MNWQAIGALGELIGAIAVLVTLVYLTVQVRNARSEMRQSVLQYRDQAVQSLLIERLRSSDLRSAYIKANQKFGVNPLFDIVQQAAGLTPEEAQDFVNYMLAWWFYRAETIRNITELSDSQKIDFDMNIHLNYSQGLGKVWFDAWQASRTPGDPTLEYCLKVLASKKENWSALDPLEPTIRPAE